VIREGVKSFRQGLNRENYQMEMKILVFLAFLCCLASNTLARSLRGVNSTVVENGDGLKGGQRRLEACPCKEITVKHFNINTYDKFWDPRPEGWVEVGVQQNGEGSKHYEWLGVFKRNGKHMSGSSHSIKVTPADKIWIRLTEYDGGKGLDWCARPENRDKCTGPGNQELEASTTLLDLAPPDAEISGCTNYDVEYGEGVLEDPRGNTQTITLGLRGLTAEECPGKEPDDPEPDPTSDPDDPPSTDMIPLCMVDDRGRRIPRDSPKFDTGIIVYSETMTESDSKDAINEVMSAMKYASEIAQSTSDVLGSSTNIKNKRDLKKSFRKLTSALDAVGGAFGIATGVMGLFTGGPSELERVLDAIKDEFANTNAKIDELGLQMKAGFDDMKEYHIDNDLEDIKQELLRLNGYYKDFIRNLNNRSGDGYEDEFRKACKGEKSMTRRPHEIIGAIYAMACGDSKGYPDQCEKETSFGGCSLKDYEFSRATGQAYFFDHIRKYNDASRLFAFERWAIFALEDALFLHAACGSGDDCFIDTDHQEKKLELSIRAAEEVLEHIDAATEKCSCPCKEITVKSVHIDMRDKVGRPEGWVAVGVQQPGERGTSRNYEYITTFKKNGTFGSGSMHSIIVTPADTVWFRIIEYDGSALLTPPFDWCTRPENRDVCVGPMGGANNDFEKDATLRLELAPPNAEHDTRFSMCADYDVKYQGIVDEQGRKQTFSLGIKALSVEECKERRPEYCDDFPVYCPEGLKCIDNRLCRTPVVVSRQGGL